MHDELIIRRARPEDFPQVDALMELDLRFHAAHRPQVFQTSGSGYSRAEFDALLADPDGIALLAELEGQTAGLCFGKAETIAENAFLRPARTAMINDLAVFPAFRRRGAARALLEQAKRQARALGAAALTLRVWQFNEGAAALYRSLGFEVQWSHMEAKL